MRTTITLKFTENNTKSISYLSVFLFFYNWHCRDGFETRLYNLLSSCSISIIVLNLSRFFFSVFQCLQWLILSSCRVALIARLYYVISLFGAPTREMFYLGSTLSHLITVQSKFYFANGARVEI